MGLFSFFKRSKNAKPSKNTKQVEVVPEKKIPLFEEVYEIVDLRFCTNPLPSDASTEIEESILEKILRTLLVDLPAYVEKMGENPSHQQKELAELDRQLRVKGVERIGSSEWSYSSGNGIAARVIVHGKSRTALVGMSGAMRRAVVNYPLAISELVERSSATGNDSFVFAIDGLAYGACEISHRIQEVNPSD
jgi:hypothetical protein